MIIIYIIGSSINVFVAFAIKKYMLNGKMLGWTRIALVSLPIYIANFFISFVLLATLYEYASQQAGLGRTLSPSMNIISTTSFVFTLVFIFCLRYNGIRKEE